MNTKIMSLLAFAAFVLASASRADFTSGDFYYQTNGAGVTITRYVGSSSTVTIPSLLGDLPVTSIGDGAFSWCSSLTSITIPNCVTSIGSGAFYRCSSLPSIDGFQYVTWVNGVQITGYAGVGGDIAIPTTINELPVTSIGFQAFSGCSSLTSIVIPNNVTSIGSGAFNGCSSLTSIVIPNSVTSIGSGAFYRCSSLTSIVIPNSVTSIGDYAFSGCSSLPSIDGFQYVTWGKEVQITGYAGAGGDVAIPSTINGLPVRSIGFQAFFRCSSLTSIVIPNSVSSIENGAFEFCSSLTSIVIPNSVTSIGNAVFLYCNSLMSIVIPNSVTSIGYWAFDGCSSLTNVVIPDSVTSIGGRAFDGCSSLTNLMIPDSVTSIRDGAFNYCSSLTNVVIPNSVTSIGDGLFDGCSSLTSITIPNSVTSIGGGAFSGCSSLTWFKVSEETWNWLLQNAHYLGLDKSHITHAGESESTIAFPAIAPVTYGVPPFALTATASSGLPVSFSSSSTNISIAGSIVAVLGTGTASVVASQALQLSNWSSQLVTNSLVVNGPNPTLKTQTITFSALKAKSWTNLPFALTATASSKLPITYTSSDPSIATVSNNILTPIGVGTTTITAYQGGNTIYNPARPVSQPQVITKATQTITFPKIANHTFGDAPFRLSATSSSGLPVTYTSSATNVATVLGDVVTIVGAGSAKITATQSGNGLYYVATPANQNLTVSKAKQTVTFKPSTPVNYTNGGIIPFNGTASSGLPITYKSSKTSVIMISAGATNGVMKSKGTTTITASQAGNANYNGASALATITLQ